MPSEQLRFRCYQCNKLLGVSPSKAGKVVSCPSCSAELIVPEPEVEDEPDEVAFDLPTVREGPPTERASPIPPIDTGFRARGDSPTSIMTEPTPSKPIFPLEPESKVQSTVDLPALGFLNTDTKPTDELPVVEVESDQPIREREPRRLGRDVVLPRGVVAAWSLLVLLAVVAAFASGLLVGHFVWKR